MYMEHIEFITSGEQVLAILVGASFSPPTTSFITSPEHMQQVGFVVYPEGGEIEPHTHKPISRELVGTSEVIRVQKGRCEIDLHYNGKVVATRTLVAGDLIIFIAGGHGFRMLADTILLEIKQGPYYGVDEKEYLG